jgi:phosphoglycolate phosphatase-like HAD superfamily hydrolase
VFVGDSIWDAHAARNAGVVCIGVTCGGTSRAELASAGMAQVYVDPDELVANFDRSPLAAR